MAKQNISLPFFILITMLPLLAGLVYALLNSLGLAGILSEGFTLNYWKEIFSSGEFLQTFFYSIFLTAVVVLLSVFIALVLQKNFKNKISTGATSFLFYIPLAIPFIVAAFLTYHFIGASGLFARIAFSLHLISDQNEFPGFVNDANSIGIILTHCIIATAFLTILFATIYKNEKLEELSSAANTLGADEKQVRSKIIIPVLLKKAMPSIILYAVFTFGSYEIPLLLGRQDPQMISVTIARKFQRYNLQDVPVAYAMASIYTLLIIVVLFVLYKRKKLQA